MNNKKNENLATLSQIITAIQEKKGKNISTLNFENISNSICDYFVICEADNARMVDSIVDEIEKQVHEKINIRPHHIEGKENSNWVLLDYFNIIVHVFQDNFREFYSLEKLWADAEITHINE
jgi:ribosome-associated protein